MNFGRQNGYFKAVEFLKTVGILKLYYVLYSDINETLGMKKEGNVMV